MLILKISFGKFSFVNKHVEEQKQTSKRDSHFVRKQNNSLDNLYLKNIFMF